MASLRRPATAVSALLVITAVAVLAGGNARTHRAGAAVTLPAGFVDAAVAGGISSPTAMTFAPDGRIFVAQQTGELRVIKNGSLLATPFLTLTVDSTNERGLLGVAFDPAFATNHYLYLYYTTPTPAVHNRLSRFTASGDVVLAGSEAVLLDLDNLSTATNHNGGAIHFGPDGKLYVGVGENANGANAQTLTNLLGKVLRINSDGSIPADNPFYATATGQNRAIWAMGLRNPFTFAFQPGSGRMFINDVGQSAWEEIDDGIAGSNYGWPTTEGATNNPAFRTPLFSYGHGSTSTTGCAIAGGAFYNPAFKLFPASYTGKYFFADLCGGWIRLFDPANNSASDFAQGLSQPVDLMVGTDGALYYLARGTGSVGRIAYVPAYGVRWDGNGAPANMTAGATSTFPVSFTNIGSVTWAAGGPNPVRGSYHWLTGACSGANTTAVWDGARTALTADVATNGGVVDLDISVAAPAAAGAYCLQLDLVREGMTWFSAQGAQTLKLDIDVGQRPLSVAWGAHGPLSSMPAAGSAGLVVSITNDGSQTWPAGGANPVRASYHWLNGACPGSTTAVWDGVRTVLASNIASGETANMTMSVHAPPVAGSYCLRLDMVQDGVTWFSAQGLPTLSLSVTVLPKALSVAWGGAETPATMDAGQLNAASLSFTNNGSATWPAVGTNPVHVAYHWRNGACPGSTTAVWDGRRTSLAAPIAPGGSVAGLAVQVLAPVAPATYCLVYDLVQEGVSWFSTQGSPTLATTVTVKQQYGVQWTANNAPSTMNHGATSSFQVSFKNTGTITWPAGGANPAHFAYHWRNGACPGAGTVVWDGLRTSLSGDVAPNVTVANLTVQVTAPPAAGSYCLVLDMVQEGVTWFSSRGAATLNLALTVN